MDSVGSADALADDMPRPAARVGVHIQNLFYRFGLSCGRFTKYRLYCSRNIVKANRAIKKRRHSHFVGGVERDGLGSSRFDCFVSQT